jgi:ribosomal protein S18 acetylase RimI-like enzyme
MFSIRPAVTDDIASICTFDPIVQHDGHRRAVIARSIDAGACSVIVVNEQVVGYAILEYSFYEQGFIALLYIHPDHRRRGAGLKLMRHLETACQTAKLFISTNLSNLPMQSLLAKLEYTLSRDWTGGDGS